MTAGCLPVEPVLGLRPGWRPKASSSFLPSWGPPCSQVRGDFISKSETLSNLEQGRGRTASSRQDWVFSPIRPKHSGAHWKVFYFRETPEMCFDCSGYGRSGGPTCSVELGENQGVSESRPCSSTHHRIVLVQGITTHFKDLLYYHQKMFAPKELSIRNGLKNRENWSNHFFDTMINCFCIFQCQQHGCQN